MKRFAILLPLLLLFASSALAAEALKDYMFRGMPNYTLGKQEKNFNRLMIKSQKPESTEVTETAYEGNLVYSYYEYAGKSEEKPSNLQIMRNYQGAVKQLDGKILWDNGDNEFHASFTRNGKPYVMTVWSYSGARYEVKILELAEMKNDVQIIDADTILYNLDTEGHIALYINFDSGKSTIKPESGDVIDEVAAALKAKPDMKVKLEGHTDNVGNAEANKKLSNDRANAVMNAIIAKGIDKSRLSAEGFGLDKPIADNSTEEGRAKNRRVELVKQ